MKAGTQNHVKTKRLMRLLGISMYRAVGILETMWLLCTDCADEGEIGKFADEEIADYLGWDGKQSPSQLVTALHDSGWIDKDDEHRFVIHDWFENAPEFIKDRIRKRKAREAKEGKKQRNITTYDQSKPDNDGQNRTTTGQAGDCPVYSNTITTNTNQSQPNQSNPIISSETDSPSSELVAVVDEIPVLEFPCDGKPGTWALVESQLAQWRALYPSLDVDAECRKAYAWVLSDAANRKTSRGMPRFLVGWLNRNQNRGGARRQSAHAAGSVDWT